MRFSWRAIAMVKTLLGQNRHDVGHKLPFLTFLSVSRKVQG